ncbi:hypothetical protein PHMEG_00034174 [Phytophthora megakarya]|uniref:Sugar phosphate phosphatase n=1 Tax=Phytophthora megakarya TaxID=4795 RepID=A0A225URL7_9STRA|nr:hypothetical protein PHMEG_00034174 [Phytophthora megakarya]
MKPSIEFLERVHRQVEIRTDVPGSFANDTYVSRFPELLRDCLADNHERFSAEQRDRILQLIEGMHGDADIPLPSQLPKTVVKSFTSEQWEQLLAGEEYTWQNSPWFLGEQYVFHWLLLITDYYSTGIDPFRSLKVKELSEGTPWRLLQNAIDLPTESGQDRNNTLKRFLKLCLWGNKADGCNKEVKNTVSEKDASLVFSDELLLVDHSDRVISLLEQKAHELEGSQYLSVEYINDNSGTELLLDLALADHLLSRGWCGKGTFNDILWNCYSYYWEFPTKLHTRLARESTLVIIKGDLNYRHLLGDRLWAPTTPVEEAVPYFPTAFVALRTLKSDPVVGLSAETVNQLEKEDPNWRCNGMRSMIQSVLTLE